MSEPARRSSSCSSPTALFLGVVGAEGIGAHQFGQPVGLVGLGLPFGSHLVQHHGHAAAGKLPGGLRTGEAAADDVNGGDHGARP